MCVQLWYFMDCCSLKVSCQHLIVSFSLLKGVPLESSHHDAYTQNLVWLKSFWCQMALQVYPYGTLAVKIRDISSRRLALLFWEPVVPPCSQNAHRTKLMFTVPLILQRLLLNTWRATVSLCAETRRSFCRPRHCHFVSFNAHIYSVILVVFLFREVNKFLPFIFPASKEITAPEEKSSVSSY